MVVDGGSRVTAGSVRVRGPGKVYCHPMFGILALTVEQLMRWVL